MTTHPWPPPASVRVALAHILEDPTINALLKRFDPKLLEMGEQALGEHPKHKVRRPTRPVLRCGGCRTANGPIDLYDRIARAQGASRGRLYTHVWLCATCARKTEDASPARLLPRNPSLARTPPPPEVTHG